MVRAPLNHAITQFLQVQTNYAYYMRIGYHSNGIQTLQCSNFVNNTNEGQSIILAEYSIDFYLNNCVLKDNNSTNTLISILYSSKAKIVDISNINNKYQNIFYHHDDSSIDSNQAGATSQDIFINLPNFDTKIPKIYVNTCPIRSPYNIDMNTLIIAPIIDLS